MQKPSEAEMTAVRHWQNFIPDFTKDMQELLNQCDRYRVIIDAKDEEIKSLKEKLKDKLEPVAVPEEPKPA